MVRVRGRVNLREVAEGQKFFAPLIGHAGLSIVSAVVQHPLQLVFIPTRKVVGVHLLGFTVRVTGVHGGFTGGSRVRVRHLTRAIREGVCSPLVLQDSEIKLHFRDPDWVRGGALGCIGVLLATPLALPISHVGHEVIATDVRFRVRVSG